MILNGGDPVCWLHPTCSAEDSEQGQENAPHSTPLPLTARPGCQVLIPVPNNNTEAAAPSTRDLSSLDPPQPISSSDVRRTDSDTNHGSTRYSGRVSGWTAAEAQLENDDPFRTTLVLGPSLQQRGSACLGSGRRVSSDPEVCELFRESMVTRCGDERAKVAGFQRWQKGVEGQRASLVSKTFGSDFFSGGRCNRGGQLRDLNVIQRPSLDFDKMQRYCLARVHPTRGISKPRVVKVKCLPGSSATSSSFSSRGRDLRGQFLDPSIFSFRSISQNPNSSSRRNSATTPSLSDEN